MDVRLLSISLGRLSSIILCVGIILGLAFYKKLNALHKSILCYLAFMLAVDVASSAIMLVYTTNLIILPIFSLVEMLFFIYFFNRHLLAKPNGILIGLGAMAALFIIAEFSQYFVFNTLNIKEFQPYAKVADNFIVIVMALFFFYQKANSFCETKITYFRLNAAILTFFTLNAIMFLPFNFFINNATGVQFNIWLINVFLINLFYGYLVSLIWTNGTRHS